jgi:hypothetical protein
MTSTGAAKFPRPSDTGLRVAMWGASARHQYDRHERLVLIQISELTTRPQHTRCRPRPTTHPSPAPRSPTTDN